MFQVVFDGHKPEEPGDFTSVEQTVDEVTEYLKAHGIARLDAAYGCSLGGACLTRFLVLGEIPVGRAIIDGGITPYQLPYLVRKLILARDVLSFKLAANDRKVLEAAFPPERFTIPGHDPVKEYDAIEAYLKTYSDRTIRRRRKEGPPGQHPLHQALFPADPDPRDPENGTRGAGHRASGGILPVRGEIPGRAGGGGTARRDAGLEDDQMKDNELQFDRSCHVLYSKPCKKEILAKIALHYPAAEREAVWEQVQRQYVDFLADWRTDLGGKKNFHNGAGGTYDCIAILSYYVACRAVTSFREIEAMEENLILPAFRRLKFVDCNKPFFKKLMYKAFTRAKSLCDQWRDYEMAVSPFDKDKPIYYEFTACPAAEFAIKHGLTDIMPALCNVDYASMELIHARLVRTTTCANGCKCDYTICGDKDPYLRDHPEYRDETGYRRNQ